MIFSADILNLRSPYKLTPLGQVNLSNEQRHIDKKGHTLLYL